MFGYGLVPWRFRSSHNLVKAHANFFFRFVLRTPPMPCRPDADVEAHVLVCKRDLHMCLLAVKSFLRFAPNVALVVHDDGTVGEAGCALLARHLPGARLITRAEADQALLPLLPPKVAEARARHVLLMKVFDFNFFNSDKRTILLDSDLVFRHAPHEAVAWIAGQDRRAFYNPDPMIDTYRASIKPPQKLPDFFNSGFVGYRHKIGLERIVCAIQTMDYWLEDQTVYAYLLASHDSCALDSADYLIYQGGAIPDGARMVHFISPNRFTDMAYVRLGREVCAQLAA